jgi:hypothetical protein
MRQGILTTIEANLMDLAWFIEKVLSNSSLGASGRGPFAFPLEFV